MAEHAVHTEKLRRAIVASRAPSIRCWPLVPILALFAEAGCSNRPPQPAESPRLHVVGVLYGKYVSAHDGQMPADRDELVRFVDSSQREILQRRGYKSAEEVFAQPANKSRLVVLYRDERERLQTEFVAIEERKFGELGTDSNRISTKWYAADVLGAAQEIDEQQAKRVLAEAG